MSAGQNSFSRHMYKLASKIFLSNRFGANTKVVHFLGSTKPWNYTYDSRTKSIKGNMDDPKIVHPEFLNMWWDTYVADVLPLLEQHGIVKEITTGASMVRALIILYIHT